MARTLSIVARAGESVDSVVWRAAGTRVGLVEETLEANRGLAELGPFLPEGTVVEVPFPAATAPAAPLVQLWS